MYNKPKEKEEHAIVLDFLQNGHNTFSSESMQQQRSRRPPYRGPIIQALGKKTFVLLELAPKPGLSMTPTQEVYIGQGKREEIHHIVSRVTYDKLTATAKSELGYAVERVVKEDATRFINFFNKADALSTRMHSLELIPGIGKKHMWEIIEEREEEDFKDFADMKARVKLLPDPEKAIIQRIMAELMEKDKHRFFVKQ